MSTEYKNWHKYSYEFGNNTIDANICFDIYEWCNNAFGRNWHSDQLIMFDIGKNSFQTTFYFKNKEDRMLFALQVFK